MADQVEKGVRVLNPSRLLKSIYFGDRFCTKIVFDGYKNQVELHINMISRIRDASGEWNFYFNEDIENGVIVITGVKKVIFNDSGLIPNDQIYEIQVNEIGGGDYEFVLEMSHVDEKALTHDLVMKVIGGGVHLLDPNNPDGKIID